MAEDPSAPSPSTTNNPSSASTSDSDHESITQAISSFKSFAIKYKEILNLRKSLTELCKAELAPYYMRIVPELRHLQETCHQLLPIISFNSRYASLKVMVKKVILLYEVDMVDEAEFNRGKLKCFGVKEMAFLGAVREAVGEIERAYLQYEEQEQRRES